MPSAFLPILLKQVFGLIRLLLVNSIDFTIELLGASFLGTTFHPLFAEDFLLDLHPMHLFPGIIVPFPCRMPWLHSS